MVSRNAPLQIPSPFDAILFDLDGTLVDSEAVAQAAGELVFSQYGIAEPKPLLQAIVGQDDPTARAYLAQAIAPIPLDPVFDAWRKAIRARFVAEGIPLKPHARHVLAALHKAGIPLGIVTSSQAQSAEFKLQAAGLTPYFQTIITRQDVSDPKPAPAPYLLAAARLGVDPKRCLAFEDSQLGARAAYAAGMTTVQIPDVIPAPADAPWSVQPDLRQALAAHGVIV